MALSGSVATGEMEGRSVTLSWTATQSVTNNTSTVSWTLKTTGSYSAGVAVREVSAKINGSSVYHTDSLNSIYGGNVPANYTIATGSFTVNHNSSGAGSFTAYVGAGIYYQWAINTENTKTFTLDTIARASSISVPSGGFTMGTAGTITITKANSSYTDTLTWRFGNASGTIVTKTSSTSVSWTPTTATLAPQIPNATSGTGTITCTTYNGNTSVGSKSVSFTATVPTSVKPTVSNVAVAMDNTANATIAGWGVAVKGYTKARVTASGAGSNGSTISSFAITGGYTQSVAGTSLDYTGDPITSTGTVNFSVSSVDTRGRTSTASSASLTVYDYSNPTISKFTVNRSSTQTNKVIVNANWTFASVGGKNSVSTALIYKQRNLTSWSDPITISKNTNVTLSPTFDVTKSYDFQLTITDAVGNSATMTGSVSTQDVLLDFRAGGAGLGIGKIIESDSLVEIKDDWNFKTHGKEIKTLIKDEAEANVTKLTGVGTVGDSRVPIYFNAGVPTEVTNDAWYYTYTVDTTQKAASAWRRIVASNSAPSWTIPKGVYMITLSATIKSATGSVGIATIRLWNSSNNSELGGSDGNTSRQTIPTHSTFNTTFNTTLYHKQQSSGNFSIYPEVYAGAAFTASDCFLSMVRVADTWSNS